MTISRSNFLAAIAGTAVAAPSAVQVLTPLSLRAQPRSVTTFLPRAELRSTFSGEYLEKAPLFRKALPIFDLTDIEISRELIAVGATGFELNDRIYRPSPVLSKRLNVGILRSQRYSHPDITCYSSTCTPAPDPWSSFDVAFVGHYAEYTSMPGSSNQVYTGNTSSYTSIDISGSVPTTVFGAPSGATPKYALCRGEIAALVGAVPAMVAFVIQNSAKYGPGAVAVARSFAAVGPAFATIWLCEMAVAMGPVGWLLLLSAGALTLSAYWLLQKCQSDQ